MTRILVVEDRPSYRSRLTERLRAAPLLQVAFTSHRDLLTRNDLGKLRVDLVLLDAYDTDTQQEDPLASRFAALDVCARLAEAGSTAPIAAYSTAMARPEVNIPLREWPSVVACFTHTGLLDSLEEIAAGRWPATQVDPPTLADYHALGVGPGAKVSAAHHLMRSRSDAWDLVALDVLPTPRPATREWINDQVRPLLDISMPSYRPVVAVLRQVAGLPAPSSFPGTVT